MNVWLLDEENWHFTNLFQDSWSICKHQTSRMSSHFVMFRFRCIHLFLGSSVNISVYNSPKLPCDPELDWVHGENVSGLEICLLTQHFPRFDSFIIICITLCESGKNQQIIVEAFSRRQSCCCNLGYLWQMPLFFMTVSTFSFTLPPLIIRDSKRISKLPLIQLIVGVV